MIQFWDTNLWIALTFPRHPAHLIATDLLTKASTEAPLAFSSATQISFLRLATTAKIWRAYQAEPISNQEAAQALQLLLKRPEIIRLEEPVETQQLWLELAQENQAAPRKWMDAYLAAFAMKSQVRLVTLDSDFLLYQKQGLKLNLLKFS